MARSFVSQRRFELETTNLSKSMQEVIYIDRWKTVSFKTPRMMLKMNQYNQLLTRLLHTKRQPPKPSVKEGIKTSVDLPERAETRTVKHKKPSLSILSRLSCPKRVRKLPRKLTWEEWWWRRFISKLVNLDLTTELHNWRIIVVSPRTVENWLISQDV